jgi:hypothetical protein
MDRDRIEEEFRKWVDDDDTDQNWEPCDVKAFAESIADIARNDAMEEAIRSAHQSIDSLEKYCPQTLEYAKDAIRALKETK